MIIGSVNPYREALLGVTIHGPQGQEQEIEAIVDTGYTGSLSLPLSVVSSLGLPFLRRGRALLADGSESYFDIYEATLIWDNQPLRIAIDAVDADPLLGMELMHGYELTVQVVDGGSVTLRSLSLP